MTTKTLKYVFCKSDGYMGKLCAIATELFSTVQNKYLKELK